MNIVVPQTGIDVAQKELVVSIDQGKPFRKRNTEEGCLELAALLPKDGVVHLEASGGYERLVRRTLTEAGIKVVVHNPLKPRRMAQARGIRAKTDPVDAKVLSDSGSLLPERSSKSQERQQLADHSRAIDALKKEVAAFKKRINVPELDAMAKQLYMECILDLQKRIDAAEKAFEKRIKASAYAAQYKLIRSVPALGKITARICICEFPEDVLERDPGQIASYAGLAPIDDSSGTRTGKARIGHGNSRLKAGFYMPALTALRSQSWARKLYARLRASGRTHDQAIVPLMRRLLIRAVAVVKRGSTWEVEPQKA